MTTAPGPSALRLFIILVISTLLISCGGGNPAGEGNGAGIAFRLKWPVAKSVGSAPAGVDTIRMSVSGPGMEPISKDFPASDGTGSITGVPVGGGRTITFQGLDSSLKLVYEAVIPNVTLLSGPPYVIDPVTMKSVGTTAPTIPLEVQTTVVSDTQVDLTWIPSTNNTETTYSIERKTENGTYVQIATVAAPATVNLISYSDIAVTASKTYTYQVQAVNGNGLSDPVTPPPVTTPYSISGTITSGGAALPGVTVTLSGSGTAVATTNAAGIYSFSALNGDYTLTPGKTDYTFSPASLAVTVNGANLSAMDFVATPVPVIPAAPSGLVATAVSSNLINLSWRDNSSNETGFRIERSESGGAYAQIATVAANITTYRDTVPAASTVYFYRVQATSGVGDSGYIEANAATLAAGAPISPVFVTVTGTFSIGMFEVTQEEWSSVMGSNPSLNTACGLGCPVENVSWNDVQNFITTLNAQSGKNYRLPTDAEWQYAAQSGGTGQLYSGTSDPNAVGEYAWYSVNSGNTIHQDLKLPNGLGIYNMSGNASEWVNDRFGSTGNNKVIRGGSWRSPASVTTTTFSSGANWDAKGNNIGFRLAQ